MNYCHRRIFWNNFNINYSAIHHKVSYFSFAHCKYDANITGRYRGSRRSILNTIKSSGYIVDNFYSYIKYSNDISARVKHEPSM